MRHELGHDRAEDARPLWQRRLSCESPFCRALVANGYLSQEQMQRAALRYRLGMSRDGGDGWQFDVMRLFLDAMRGREEIGGAELRSEVCRLANITQYKFYNKLLQRAQDEKVIVKVERDRHTFYQPAPF